VTLSFRENRAGLERVSPFYPFLLIPISSVAKAEDGCTIGATREMNMIALTVSIVWTLLVIRLICFRTTLGVRTLVSFLFLGASLGPLATAVAERFFNAYYWQGNYFFLIIAAFQNLALLAPILPLLGKPAWLDGTSIADSFLGGFLIGFGYDMVSAILAVASQSQGSYALSFLPPGVASGKDLTVAGYGYWVGFTAVATVAGFRFFKWRVAPYVCGCSALLLTALDHFFSTRPAENVPEFWTRMTIHGNLFPWIVLVSLISLVIFERKFMPGQKTAGNARKPPAGIQNVLSALVALHWNEARRQGTLILMRRQAEYLEARGRGNPGTGLSSRTLGALASQIHRIESGHNDQQEVTMRSFLLWLKSQRLQLIFTAVALWFLVLGSLSGFDSVNNWLWTSWPMTTMLPPFEDTLLQTVLVAIVIWRYVIAPPASGGSVIDSSTRVSLEQRLLQTGLGLAVIAVLYPKVTQAQSWSVSGDLISLNTPITLALGLGNSWHAAWTSTRLTTVMLFLLVAVTAITLRSANLWRIKTQAQRMEAVLHRAKTVGTTFLLTWTTLVFFTQAQTLVHTQWGNSFFAPHFGKNGNTAIELMLGLLAIPFVILLRWFLGFLMKKAEGYLTQAPRSTPEPPKASASRAGGS
jgi:hypothetical protein